MEIKLLPHQHNFVKEFFGNNLYWAIAIVSGFGGGKSYTLATTAVLFLVKYPGKNIGVYSVTFDLLKLVNVPQIQNLLDEAGLKYKLNKQDMIISVVGYGKIVFRSLDNPARIIGYETGISLIDELDTLPLDKAKHAWNMVIARNRQPLTSGFRNKVGVFTTPEGYRFVYSQWKKQKVKGYLLLKAKTTDNKHLREDYVQNLRDTYPDNLIDAYINGEFVNLNGEAVYYAFNRVDCHEEFDYSMLEGNKSNVINF